MADKTPIQKHTYDRLAIDNLDDFVFGTCPHPVTTRSGLEIGGGKVLPELNFTLPTIDLETEGIEKAYEIYRSIAHDSLARAAALINRDAHGTVPGVTLEYETTVEFTLTPEWGIEVNRILLDEMHRAEEEYGLKSALRFTVNDNREFVRPPEMRSGENWEKMKHAIAQASVDGADFISIESTGGKEISDDSIVRGDLAKYVFALGVMAPRDMAFLWDNFAEIAVGHGSIPAGDSSCGFANTAMVLAEKGFVPRMFAAVARVATVPRALVAYERGAWGPSKDCEYVGPYLKAITGAPITMEGRTCAGAHLSQVGNIAGAVADLWSNESIQYIRLLSDMAPTVHMEQLIYDCRLYNTRDDMESKRAYRDLLVDSDCYNDPQAWVLRPDVAIRISKEIIREAEPLKRTKVACAAAIEEIRKAIADGNLKADRRDEKWLKRMDKALAGIPDDPGEFWEQIKPSLDLSTFRPGDYELE